MTGNWVCIVDQRSVEDYFVPTVIVTTSQQENSIFVFLHLADSNCLSAPSSHLWNSLHLSFCGFQLYVLWALWVCLDVVVEEGEAQEVGVVGWAAVLWSSVWCTCVRLNCYGAKTTLDRRAVVLPPLPVNRHGKHLQPACVPAPAPAFGPDSFTCRVTYHSTTRES